MKKPLLPIFLAASLCVAPLHSETPNADSEPDIAKLEAAAAAGDVSAKVRLAKAYFRAEGVEKDADKSVVLLTEAAEEGNSEAMDGLGYLHTLGEGVPLDEAKALEWFRKGAEAGWPRSQLNLGLLLRQGKTIELDNEESLVWIQKAADGGFPEAQAVYGRILFQGDRLQASEHERSVPYVRAAAEAGDRVCQNIMGIISRDGVGTEAKYKDQESAESWFRKAALQNDLKAQTNLAVLLGISVPDSPNRREALKWLISAKEQGEITARKTYDELMPTFTSSMLAAANIEATRFLNIQRVKLAGNKNKEPALAKPVSETEE